jgi:hypothetical protein
MYSFLDSWAIKSVISETPSGGTIPRGDFLGWRAGERQI